MPACHFERVHTNPNGVENNLSRHHGYDQYDSGVERSAMTRAGERGGDVARGRR